MDYTKLLDDAESKYGLPKGLLHSQMQVESNGNPEARSPRGAVGLMQFMPDTAEQYGIDPINAEQSIDGAGRYMRDLVKQTGNTRSALAAYNWGIGNLQRKGIDAMPDETRSYIDKVSKGMKTAAKSGLNTVVPTAHAEDATNSNNIAKQSSSSSFDPDAYLSTKKTAFNPDAYLASKAQPSKSSGSEYSFSLSNVPGNLKNLAGGAAEGIGQIGATIAQPVQALADGRLGNNAEMRKNIAENLRRMGVDTDAGLYTAGKLGAEVVGTLPVGGVVGKAVGKALPALGEAIASGGFTLGKAPAATIGEKAVNAATRVAGGAINGAATVGAVNPDDAGVGAFIGGAFPVAAKVAGESGKLVRDTVRPLYESGRESILGERLLEQAGSNPARVIENLKNAQGHTEGFNPTVGQASGSDELATLERVARGANPGAFQDTMEGQTKALADAVRQHGGDDASRAKLINNREDITSDLRDAALSKSENANTKIPFLNNAIDQSNESAISALQQAGKWETESAIQKGLSDEFYPVSGYPRIAGRYSNNADRVPEYASGAEDAMAINGQRKAEAAASQSELDMLNEYGLNELKPDPIINAINSTLNTPGLRSSEVVNNSLNSIKEKLIRYTDDNGNIHPQDLYTIRKEIGDVISKNAKETNNWDKKLTGGIERRLQLAIDKQIEKSAGGGWQAYLDNYKSLSKPINQMDLGNAVADKFIPASQRDMDIPISLNYEALAKSLRENGEGLAQKATGYKGATLENTASPGQLQDYQNVLKDIEYVKQGMRGKMAGSDTFQNLLFDAKTKDGILAHIPFFKGVSAASLLRVRDFIYKQPNEALQQKLLTVLQDPSGAALLMESAQKGSATSGLVRMLKSPAIANSTELMLIE